MKKRTRHKVAVITFDTDWIGNDAVAYVQEQFLPKGLPTTWFVTGKYPSLQGTPGAALEKAIHIDFKNASSLAAQIKKTLQFAPESTGYRGHSLFWSERLRPILRANNITYDSSMLLYMEPDIRPYSVGYNIVELPIYFMDMFHLEYRELSGKSIFAKDCLELAGEGLKIFDFHPIHLLLNTPNQAYYFSRKKFYNSTELLLKQKFRGYGMANFFHDTIKQLEKKGYSFRTLQQVVEQR